MISSYKIAYSIDGTLMAGPLQPGGDDRYIHDYIAFLYYGPVYADLRDALLAVPRLRWSDARIVHYIDNKFEQVIKVKDKKIVCALLDIYAREKQEMKDTMYVYNSEN